MRAHGQLNSEMPLRQYFLFVGGALLTLLFAANWLMPLPASNELINSDVKLPVIRIHSELKGPDAVVIDTSRSTVRPLLAVREDIVAPQAVTPSESTLDEAFAHLDAPLRPQADVSEQRKTGEGQQPTSRKFMEARLERRRILIHRSHSAHVEPVPVHSGVDFSESFAQLVPNSLKQAGRGEVKNRRPITVFNQGW
jgi:hypothetical protein